MLSKYHNTHGSVLRNINVYKMSFQVARMAEISAYLSTATEQIVLKSMPGVVVIEGQEY